MSNEINISSVFVYGTLKRGQCREKLWPVTASIIQKASVRGELWGRHDYPALIRGSFHVIGELFTFNVQQIPEVLRVLDQIEGTDGNSPDDLYHRHVVEVKLIEVDAVRRAYAYFYARSPEQDGFHRVPVTNHQFSDAHQSWPKTRG